MRYKGHTFIDGYGDIIDHGLTSPTPKGPYVL